MSVGRIGEFEVSSGNWSMYVERLDMYFKANEIKKEVQLPTLIAVMGPEAYELLSNLSSPKKPAEMTYEEVTTIMRNHVEPKSSFMAGRYRLRQRRQGDDETVAQFLTELKKLSKHCEFGATLEENLRDQFTCGLKNEVIKQRLFAEKCLTYQKAVTLALSLETAERDAAMVERPSVSESSGIRAGSTTLNSFTTLRRPNNRSGSNGGSVNMQNNNELCAGCGRSGHRTGNCPYKNFTCNKCGSKGHLKRVCPARMSSGGGDGGSGARVSGSGGRDSGSGARRPRRSVHHVQAEEAETPEEEAYTSASDVEEDMYHLCLNGYRPVSLSLCLDNKVINMEVDTGSAVSCISKGTYDKYFCHRPIEPFGLILKCYDGSRIKPLGVIRPEVRYENRTKSLELFVIDGGTTSLLGRQWLTELGVQIPVFHSESTNEDLCTLLDRYKELFSGGLGRFTGGRATLRVREGATPVFCRARPLPYALRERVEAELDEMVRSGVIEPVDTSDWATPLVPVRKADGGLRICADYKITLNPALMIDRYPLPKIDDLLVRLNGAQVFSKIDLSQAYNQVELDESKEYTVINTHKGLFKYNRLVYGLSSSPGIFQRIMSNLLQDIPQVEVFLDDIIIGSTDVKSHLVTLEKVLQKLHSHGMKLKKSKCSFLLEEVQYLGYVISKDGIKVDPSKVEAIVKIPRPLNVTELRSFLGLVNFYARFVPNLSSILSPLYELLKKGINWKWGKPCEVAFKKIKKILVSAEVLTHYDQNKPLILTTDASSRGIGGVLTQPGGAGRGAGAGELERPVAYVSRALNDAERNYSQIDKEALAIIFSMQKLHQFLYGRRFTLRTDHKPLVSIFGSKQGIPAMVASRLQRWAIRLSAYTYDIEYISTEANGADPLSRLPVPIKNTDTLDSLPPEQTYLHFAQNELLLDYHDIKKYTSRDQLLSRVLGYIRTSWPTEIEIRNLQPYFNRRQELYEELGCIMWGYRVIVPEGCRERVLRELHDSHMGVVKTKAFARSYVWWPGIDEAVEAMCRACTVCAAEADAPARHAPTPWPWPARPWSRIHLDFLGPLYGKIYLVMVDARTKWLEVFPVASTAANSTIEKLSEVIARWGIPRQLVSDNGPPFSSREFSSFLMSNGIEHLLSAPYHPASNGAAENGVRIIKKVIKKAVRQKQNVLLAINNFLLHYRNIAHCTTGESPSSLMLGRQARTKLDALRPDCEKHVNRAQNKQVVSVAGSHRSLQPGDKVWIRQYQGEAKWLPGQITKKSGTTDYNVTDGLGRQSHKHIDQLRRRSGVLVCPNEPSALQAPAQETPSDPLAQPSNRHGTPNRGPGPVTPEHTPRNCSSTRGSPSSDSTGGAGPAGCGTPGAPPSISIEQPVMSPFPPPEQPLPRHTRECRLKNPPKYKH